MKPYFVAWFLVLGISAHVLYLQHQVSGASRLISHKENNHVASNVCWKTLSCSFADLESMEMKNRLEYVKYMAAWKLGQLESSEELHAVEGVMEFFIRKKLAHPGSWMSFVNAAVVEAAEQGAAMALGLSNDTSGNPGSRKWADFFTKRKAGLLGDRAASFLPLGCCPTVKFPRVVLTSST
jgi:hypothetical protein